MMIYAIVVEIGKCVSKHKTNLERHINPTTIQLFLKFRRRQTTQISRTIRPSLIRYKIENRNNFKGIKLGTRISNLLQLINYMYKNCEYF